MSGGSYDYLYSKIEEASERLRSSTDSRRLALGKLMHFVAEAMHDVEWVDSCDFGPGDEHKAIDAVFSQLDKNPEQIVKALAYDDLMGRLQVLLDGVYNRVQLTKRSLK